jgi:hypothetical protein
MAKVIPARMAASHRRVSFASTELTLFRTGTDSRFSQIANDEIDNTRSEQKLEHWFANGISNNTQRPTLTLLRKFIPPVAAKSRGCLAGGETTL